jgi:hypothetical protein
MAAEQVELASVPFVTFIANRKRNGDPAAYSFESKSVPSIDRDHSPGFWTPMAGADCLQPTRLAVIWKGLLEKSPVGRCTDGCDDRSGSFATDQPTQLVWPVSAKGPKAEAKSGTGINRDGPLRLGGLGPG